MKRGVTTSTIILAVAIMFIIITSAAVIGSKSINTVNYEEYMSKLSRVNDAVNEYITRTGEIPLTGEAVSSAEFDDDFTTELSQNGDNNSNLFILDLNLVKPSGVNIGKGDSSSKNVFLISEDTNNIYYYKGYNYKGKTYYGLEK